ncbi:MULTISPECIES: 50S ribosomal protein L9 [unclassified Butyrivibrio]|jgi:large subunit ribosomal protein L9|uniref:50S ribosomal protein L9 n=1 Tax=unclassified Butyrivibrio TaxID=2639466 RepID=UPI0004014865|nr:MULTISPECIES: 50S ribosomal protein L9 [unclassified Butyrivibrio]
MEIILLEDVKSLGKKGDIVKVSDGYASNFILPKKLGVEANKANLNDLKNQKKREEKEAQELLESMKELAKEIEKANVKVTMKAGEGGRVFGSVSSKEIVAEAKKQCGLSLDKKKVQLPEPIRSFGTTEVPVKLHPQVTAILRVSVTEA